MNWLVRKSGVLGVVTRTFRNMSYIPKNRLDGRVAVVTASTDGCV